MLFAYLTASSEQWQQKADAPAPGRFWSAAFYIDKVLYAGTGRTGFSGEATSDFWAFDTEAETWSQLPDFPGGKREGATGFTANNRGFVAFGTSFIAFTNQIFEYKPIENEWVEKTSCPASFAYSHGFAIDNNYYIGPKNGTNSF